MKYRYFLFDRGETAANARSIDVNEMTIGGIAHGLRQAAQAIARDLYDPRTDAFACLVVRFIDEDGHFKDVSVTVESEPIFTAHGPKIVP